MAAADLNRDGHTDLVAACSTDSDGGAALHEVAVLMGRGDGTFNEPMRNGVPAATSALMAADLDGDGAIDLAVGQAGSILIFAGRGDGTFRDGVEVRTHTRSIPTAPR